MSTKLRIAVFKLIDIMVIFTMVFASPMSMTASALAQDPEPALATDAADYATGASAEVTGSGFTPGEYVLAASGPDGQADWGTVTANDAGNFDADSPALDSAGTYEVRAYASGWSGDWNESPLASASFTVTAPPTPTEPPTAEPTATEPPTAEPTATPTEEPTATEPPTEEPTQEPTATEPPTEEPTATEPPTATATTEPTATEPPTEEPTHTATPTDEPTSTPTNEPTQEPTVTSTTEPTQEPTNTPTEEPTQEPTATSTTEPTATPTTEPTLLPTLLPPPYIQSGKDDYAPGELVTLTGGNWHGDLQVRIIVNDDIGQTWRRDVTVTVGVDGTISDSFNLPTFFVATYSVVARGLQTARVATTTFTDKPAVNLDQCANLGTTCNTGTSSQWQNGNLGQSQATYFEGDSVPYRAVLTGLEAGQTYTLKIEYDTTQSGKHAIDYLTDFDRTETTADPCSGVAGVPSCAASTFPIPLDPNVSGAGVTQLGGQNFTIYNGSISGVSGYTLSGTYAGSSSTSIIVTFTATANGTTILAWGGHIATRTDWGLNNSAVAISGSPYHMRLTDFTCSNVSNCGVGNQDRSLSAGAVVFPASITIVKQATPEGSTSFPFTASPSPLTNFSLVDNGSSANTKVFSNITNFTTYTVTENTPSGWTLTGVVCTVSGGTSTTPPSTTTATVSINLQEGDNVTCTFSNQVTAAPALNVEKSSTTTSITAVGQVIPYTFAVTNPGNVTLTGITVTDPKCDAAPALQSGDTNNDNMLQTTETWTYTCSHTVTQAEIDGNGGGDGDLDNTVTADSNETGPDTDDYSIPITQTAAINVEKSSTTTSITAAGQVVPYTFTVTNTGNVTLTGITVTDLNCTAAPAYQSGDTNNDSQLQTTETWTYTCSHTVTQAEIDSNGAGDGDLDNTVTADSNESGPDTDDYSIPISQNAAINVEKSSTTTEITEAGQVVPYTFTVTNAGNVTLTGVTVTDPNCNTAPAFQSGDANNDSQLQVGETWIYTCGHTVTQAEIDSNGGGDGDLDNSVTADSNESGPDTDDHFIPISRNAAINVEKSSTTTEITAAGQVVPYSFEVTNEGNVTLTGITVTDANCDAAPLYVSGDTNNDGMLQVDETWTYTDRKSVV